MTTPPDGGAINVTVDVDKSELDHESFAANCRSAALMWLARARELGYSPDERVRTPPAVYGGLYRVIALVSVAGEELVLTMSNVFGDKHKLAARAVTERDRRIFRE